MVCDPGRDHARSDRIVVEYPPRRGGIAHHRNPSVADEAKDRRSRHLANSLCWLTKGFQKTTEDN
jgi:hypothetical protein